MDPRNDARAVRKQWKSNLAGVGSPAAVYTAAARRLREGKRCRSTNTCGSPVGHAAPSLPKGGSFLNHAWLRRTNVWRRVTSPSRGAKRLRNQSRRIKARFANGGRARSGQCVQALYPGGRARENAEKLHACASEKVLKPQCR